MLERVEPDLPEIAHLAIAAALDLVRWDQEYPTWARSAARQGESSDTTAPCDCGWSPSTRCTSMTGTVGRVVPADEHAARSEPVTVRAQGWWIRISEHRDLS